jgi:hypothetical protein
MSELKFLRDASLAELVIALGEKLEECGAVNLLDRVIVINKNLDQLFEAMENGVLGIPDDCASITVVDGTNLIATISLPKSNGNNEEE